MTGVEDFIALGVFNISRMFRIRRLSILYSSSFRLMLTGVYKVKYKVGNKGRERQKGKREEREGNGRRREKEGKGEKKGKGN